MLRLILTYHLTFLLLVTNVGIPVYTHICHTQARSWSSVFIPVTSCCADSKTDGCTADCHEPKEIHEDELSRMPCCEDQNYFVQSDEAYLHQLPPELSFASTTAVIPETAFTYSVLFSGKLNFENKPHGPPESFSGKTLLFSLGTLRC